MHDLQELTRPARTGNDGDHDRYAHHVDEKLVTDAYVFGTELTALCGKKFVPTRDPRNYPVCPECREIWEGLPG